MNIDFVNQKTKGNMSFLTVFLSMKGMMSKTPMHFAFALLFLSIVTSLLTFKVSLTSWMSFVLILTFSSGMMTLFMYTTSMTSNEKSKTKKSPLMIVMTTLMVSLPPIQKSELKETMKMFSTNIIMILMALVLTLTLLSISTHGHHPNQTISSSF